MTAIATLEKKVRRLEDLMRRLNASDAIRPVLSDPNALPIGAGGVTTVHLANGAVTTLKIGDNAVTGLKIPDGEITNAKIGDGEITNAKIADATIQSAKIASLAAEKIAAGSITVQLDFGVGGKAIFSGVHRFDGNGYQMKTGGSLTTAIIGVDDLSDTPETNASYWKLYGSAEDAILSNTVILSNWVSGAEKSRLWLEYGSFTQASLYAGTTLGFRASNFNNELGCYVGPIIQPTLADSSLLTFTIAAGVISLDVSFWYNGGTEHPGVVRVDTQAAAATDDLDTINGTGLRRGQLLVVQAVNTARTVVCKDGTGNLRLAGDMSLDNTEDTLTLMYNGSNWVELSRSNNGA